MKVNTLEELFVVELSDTYSAEKQMTLALPKMAKAATDKKLAQGFLNHLKETQDQILRIEKVVKVTGIKLKRNKCEAMEGLVTEGKEAIEEIEKGPVLDVALIAAAQKVEHYEIASYGTLVELARQLGWDEAADILFETLKEEKATDKKLTDLAEGGINEQAVMAA